MKPNHRFPQSAPHFARFAAAFLLLLLALFQPPHAAAAAWARSYGTATATSYVNATAVDASGNVYIAGSFDGATLALGGQTLSRIGLLDAFVAKLDANGTLLWARNYGGTGARTCGCAIAADASGNVYLGGKFDASLSAPALALIGIEDAFALKLDTAGNTIWARNYGGAGAWTGSYAIAADAAGNVYLGGSFWNANLSAPALTLIGSQDAFALKLNAAGNTTWAKNYGGAGANAFGTGIAADSSGNVYLGGTLDASLSTPALTLIGIQDAFAFKLDTAGNTVWARNYGGAGASTHGNAIAAGGSGQVHLGGDFSGADLSAPALTLIGNQDAFALSIDTSGNRVWARNFGGVGSYAYGSAIAADNAANAYLGGDFGGVKGSQDAGLSTPALTRIGNQDVFALKLNAAGNTSWSKNYGGAGARAFGYAIAADGAGNVYLGGSFDANLGAPPLTLLGGADALILKEATAYVPGATSIPTLSEWGMIILASLMALLGLAKVPRRRDRLPL